jgi:hypothetical protein
MKKTKKSRKTAKTKVKKSTKITVEYSANNSGGNWWLKDSDWKALEAAGWQVVWSKDQKGGFLKAGADGRWLGALATKATLKCNNADEAVASWKKATNQDPWEEGCNCCGPPHSFSYVDADGHYHYARTKVSSSFDGWG